MSSEFTIGFTSVVVAIAAIWLDQRARSREAGRLKEEKTRDEARIAREKGQAERRKQQDLELEKNRYEHNLQVQATERLTAWALRGSHVLSKADHLLAGSSEFGDDRWQLASELSALVDEGRWLFRNHHPEAYGAEKAPLNRGFRDNRLDPLVEMYARLLGDKAVEPCAERKDFAFKIQKLSLPLAEQATKKD
ncbi:hypothetical protein [uncultured Roseobacter sp.]|uniref:hypothetical protein n=1 Tax=uncultured Roseobacter sp. TaxID=114847 RepID=UPI00262902C4|nr:hypothetical protein [uncultured Roseobacter sp.]